MPDNTQETLDSTGLVDNELSTSPDPVTDTGTSAASSDATPVAPTPTEQAPSPADSVDAEHTPGDGEASPKAGETGVPSGNPADPYQKRYQDVQGWATKVHQANLELKKQHEVLQRQIQEVQQSYAGVQPGEIEQWRQSRARPPWDPKSPEHQSFRETVSEARIHERLIQRTTDPAQREALQKLAMDELGPAKLKLLEDWRADVRQQEYERQLNPREYFRKIIQEDARPVVHETLQSADNDRQSAMRGRQEAEKWMANKEVATPENIQKVLKYMSESKMPFEVAAIVVEREHYKSRVSQADKVRQSAEEKERLLQGNAAGVISRNPSSSKKVDVKQYLKDKGVNNSRQAIDELFNLDHQGLL